MVPTRPVITSARLVRDALAGLKDIFQLPSQNLLVDHTGFHVNYDGSSFEIIYLAAWLEILAIIPPCVNIAEETTESFIVN